MSRMMSCLAPFRIARGVLAAGALVLAASCASPKPLPPDALPQATPVDKATGVVLNEAEVARRVARMTAQLEEEGRRKPSKRIWNSLDEMPLVDTVEVAQDETVEAWIRDLGSNRGDASRKARTKLLSQGLRVCRRLRDAAEAKTLQGLAAAEILQVLQPHFDPAWSLETSGAFMMTPDASQVLAWRGELGFDLELVDPRTGIAAWILTEQAFEKAMAEKDIRYGYERPTPQAPMEDGQCVIFRDDTHVVQVNLADGTLSFADDDVDMTDYEGRRLRPDKFNVLSLADGTQIRWSRGGRVHVSPSGSGKWLQLTMGTLKAHVQDVRFSRYHFLVLLDSRLNTYERGSLKMESDPRLPARARWFHVSDSSGEVVIGGPGWKTFLVAGGSPLELRGRAPGEQGEMCAMASDPEGKWIATADSENFIRIFLAETLERVQTIAAGIQVERLEFSADGNTLLAVSPAAQVTTGKRNLRAFGLRK
jgi:hypothetical protein